MTPDTILLILILLSGFYMAWNIGANDVANAMGTSIGSGALTLRKALMIAAVLEFSGAFFFGSHVSHTIQEGIVNVTIFDNQPRLLVYGMLASLIGAGIWIQIATYYGWPVSTTHALVGAVAGFGLIIGGIEAIHWLNIFYIVSSWLLSPIIGGFLAYGIFSMLRSKIFYSLDPLQQTKKLTPILLFSVVTMLTLGVIFQRFGFHQIKWQWTLLISLFAGGVAAGIGKYIVRNFQSTHPRQEMTLAFKPSALEALEKARKHLDNAQKDASGEVQQQLRMLAEEVNHLSDSLKEEVEFRLQPSSSEYQLIEKIFAKLQLMSACLMAFSHGANDVANAIGPLAAAVSVITTGAIVTNTGVPPWTLALGGFGIVFGLATWGWRVIETIGRRITELTPTRGFAAEFSAATTVLVASGLGIPLSTTHTLVGSVLGVGFARGIEALNIGVTRDIIISWIITIPTGAAFTVAIFYLLQFTFG
jgi:PiT family inorganic phosphate transporter